MPKIPTFDAGVPALRPSPAGSAAFREAASIQQRFGRQAGEMTRAAGRAIGSGIATIGRGLGEWQQQAQAHTDAMAEIDFQNQLTNAEVAAVGGVNVAGTPKDANGQPISENPARGFEGYIPHGAEVPSPGSFAAGASEAINQHKDFVTTLFDHLTGQGVSQKARDRMQVQMARSRRRLAVHAATVGGEVAFNHSTYSTEQTVNTAIGAVSRGEITLPDALDHIDGAFGAFQGTLSGEFAAKGSALILKKHQQARQQAIWASAYSKEMAGDDAGARAIINDKRYDADLGADRQKFLHNLDVVQRQAMAQQHAKVEADKQNATLDFHAKLNDILTRDIKPDGTAMPTPQDFADLHALAQHPGAKYEPTRLSAAFKTLEARMKKPGVSDMVSGQNYTEMLSGIQTGQVNDSSQIYDARIHGKVNDQDMSRLLSALKVKDAPFEKQLSTFEQSVKSKFEHSLDAGGVLGGFMGTSDSPAMRFYRFDSALRAKIQEYHKAGKDPSSLLTPGSPDYFGDEHNLQRFSTSLQQGLRRSAAAPPAHAAAVRTNNPGAQWPNHLAKRFGATGYENLKDGNKIATFPTPVHGAAANMALLAQGYKGMTITAAERKWSGGHRSGLSGWKGDMVITQQMLDDPKFMVPFMKSTANAEAPRGANALSDAQWHQAFAMYQAGGVQQKQATNAPAVGTVMQGFRFKGGDPSKQANWEKVD